MMDSSEILTFKSEMTSCCSSKNVRAGCSEISISDTPEAWIMTIQVQCTRRRAFMLVLVGVEQCFLKFSHDD